MVSGVVSLAAGVLVLLIVGKSGLWEPLAAYMQTSLQSPQHGGQQFGNHVGRGLTTAAVTLLPVGLAGLGGWLLGNLLQSGFALRWPWSRPAGVTYYHMSGRRRDSLVRGILAAVLLAAAATSVLALFRRAATLTLETPMSTGEMFMAYLQPSIGIFVPAVVAVVILDWLSSRHSYLSAAGMTETERRRELRDSEISWLSRRRRRLRQQGGRR